MFQWLVLCLVTSSTIAAEVTYHRSRTVSARQVSSNLVTSLEKAEEVLSRYGYLHCRRKPCGESTLREAVRRYQRTYGMSPTGRLDPSTLRHLSSARCGNADDETAAVPYRSLFRMKRRRSESLLRRGPKFRRSRRQSGRGPATQRRLQWLRARARTTASGKLDRGMAPVLSAARRRRASRLWRRAAQNDGQAFVTDVVTWRLVDVGYSTQLSAATQRAALALAFRMWAEVIPLFFLEDTTSPVSDVDILIAFGKGEHLDCPNHFDGLGGQLSHAVRRLSAAEIHVDDEEKLSVGGGGTDLVQLAVHEAGHALGLFHSPRNSSVMFALYPAEAGFELAWEDRALAQSIYGVCRGSFDTVFDWVRHKPNGRAIYNTFFFRGYHYWMYENRHNRTRYGDPLRIAPEWKGVPSHLDAFVHIWDHAHDLVYLFKGRHFWLYDSDNDRVTTGYPRNISDHFRSIPGSGYPNIPGHLDSVFFDKRDGNLYFFKNNLVYGYDISLGESGCCLPGYPRRLDQEFPPVQGGASLPSRLDAVYYSYTDRAMYFFRGTLYWTNVLYDNFSRKRHNQVAGPREIASRWYDICEVDL